MKLSFDAVKRITVGSVESYEDARGMHFAKCTKKQVEAFRAFSEELAVNASATTGIRLDFHTNSKSFSFAASSGARFELYINGVFTDCILRGNEKKITFSKMIDSPYENNRITLFFPAHFEPGALEYVELDDGASVAPREFERKIFFIGDSITQGWESTYDSLSYANRVSEFFNAESIIQGIGGAFFHESIFDGSIDFDPDVAIVAFGTNDWGRFSSHEELEKSARAFLDAFVTRFEGKKTFGISPIWRGNTTAPRATGHFSEVCDTVKRGIVAHGLTLIEGERLTPHIPDFYSDGYLHPNGLGFGIYAESLCKILKNYI